MDRQLAYHQETVNGISSLLGNQTAASNLLNRCLYTVSMGNNDYINNYYFTLPLTLSGLLLSPEAFAEKLIQKYSQQLTVSLPRLLTSCVLSMLNLMLNEHRVYIEVFKKIINYHQKKYAMI